MNGSRLILLTNSKRGLKGGYGNFKLVGRGFFGRNPLQPQAGLNENFGNGIVAGLARKFQQFIRASSNKR